MIKLIKPSIKYKKSFIQAMKEFQQEGREVNLDLQDIEKDFDKLLMKFKNEENGIGLKEGYVPDSTLWLVDENDFIGRASIRHQLNESLFLKGGHIGYVIRPTRRKMGYGTKILKLSLPIAKSLGINPILITCDDDNVGSRKIIEKNGGILENTVEHNNKLTRRYWIK